MQLKLHIGLLWILFRYRRHSCINSALSSKEFNKITVVFFKENYRSLLQSIWLLSVMREISPRKLSRGHGLKIHHITADAYWTLIYETIRRFQLDGAEIGFGQLY